MSITNEQLSRWLAKWDAAISPAANYELQALIQASPEGNPTSNERNPWDLVGDKDTQQLVLAYEMVLTEMRTHARRARIDSALKEWVYRLDCARDEFVCAVLSGDSSVHETKAPPEGAQHFVGCWREPGHHACAIRQVELMQEDYRRQWIADARKDAQETEPKLVAPEPHDSHCRVARGGSCNCRLAAEKASCKCSEGVRRWVNGIDCEACGLPVSKS